MTNEINKYEPVVNLQQKKLETIHTVSYKIGEDKVNFSFIEKDSNQNKAGSINIKAFNSIKNKLFNDLKLSSENKQEIEQYFKEIKDFAEKLGVNPDHLTISHLTKINGKWVPEITLPIGFKDASGEEVRFLQGKYISKQDGTSFNAYGIEYKYKGTKYRIFRGIDRFNKNETISMQKFENGKWVKCLNENNFSIFKYGQELAGKICKDKNQYKLYLDALVTLKVEDFNGSSNVTLASVN